MTPFLNDFFSLWADAWLKFLEIYCYFFGHDWDEWSPYRNTPLGASRECKRCGDFDYDNQMFNTELKHKSAERSRDND